VTYRHVLHLRFFWSPSTDEEHHSQVVLNYRKINKLHSITRKIAFQNEVNYLHLWIPNAAPSILQLLKSIAICNKSFTLFALVAALIVTWCILLTFVWTVEINTVADLKVTSRTKTHKKLFYFFCFLRLGHLLKNNECKRLWIHTLAGLCLSTAMQITWSVPLRVYWAV